MVVFSLAVAAGVAGLQRPDAAKAAAKMYALQVADTVVVQPGGAPPEVVTALAPKGWTDAAYFFNVRTYSCQSLASPLEPSDQCPARRLGRRGEGSVCCSRITVMCGSPWD